MDKELRELADNFIKAISNRRFSREDFIEVCEDTASRLDAAAVAAREDMAREET